MGDRILALVAKLLSESTEHAYRIGGDQYAVVDMDPDGAEDFRPALTRVLLIRLTHHATRCSVSWWRFAGRVKTAIPENTLGISVPVRN